ncbi:DNA/RNA helicase domain-containing protein [Streptomyces sp. NPDC094140]|uniref:DNA/RNA helicase domain-containing protein n=1 Tax=unclassified Streptomyces TaxID=2593676 RepID=UPI003395A094
MAVGGGWKPLEAFWPVQRLVRDRHQLVRKISECYTAAHPKEKKPNTSDLNAWRESVYELAGTLDNLGLGQVRMFIEYLADGRMNHIDVVLAGQHPSGRLSYAVVELKQWSSIERSTALKPAGLCASCRKPGNSTLCQRCARNLVYAPFSGYEKHVKHPAVQVSNNMDDLRRHHSMFDDRYVNLVGAAYLHNLMDPEYQWISQLSPRPGIPTLTARQPRDLEKFLVTNFSPASGAEAAQQLLERRRTNSLLTDEIGAIVNGHTRFSLVEHQLRAVRAIADATGVVGWQGVKKVFVIEGRAGSGKSLVALTALGEALGAGRSAAFVSGGIASRDTFKRAATGHKKLFMTLKQVADKLGPDELDLVVCDEAHRLSERPMTGSFSMRSTGPSSVEVLVTRARVPVFFIDGDQRLFAEEVWSPDRLKGELQSLGVEIVPITLDRVLRTVGSSTFDTWVSRLMAGDPIAWRPDDATDPEPFELYYAESAAKMESFLSSRDPAGKSARMSAGMCWEWTDDTGTCPDVSPDPDWARPWNAGDRHNTQGVPKRKFWATDPGGFGQIGCVHTAQGLEYEWGGVIMGPDLTWEDGTWVAHREHVKSKASRIEENTELTRALRNAYGVLMTRSIRGAVLYSVDPATRKLFADLGIRRA